MRKLTNCYHKVIFVLLSNDFFIRFDDPTIICPRVSMNGQAKTDSSSSSSE
jgi:hypothetical protein